MFYFGFIANKSSSLKTSIQSIHDNLYSGCFTEAYSTKNIASSSS